MAFPSKSFRSKSVEIYAQELFLLTLSTTLSKQLFSPLHFALKQMFAFITFIVIQQKLQKKNSQSRESLLKVLIKKINTIH